MSSAACPSLLTTGGVAAATPGVLATAVSTRAMSVAAPSEGSAAATISGASNPGPNPRAIAA
jgi:hypothetical protein